MEFDKTQNVIERLIPRKNQLIRPPVANIDMALILLAPVPKPDFMLVDKLLVKFFSLNIVPIIVINKTDIASNEFVESVYREFRNVCKLISISTLNQEITRQTILPLLKGQLSILTGQSAVGKTSLLNVLVPNINEDVGELSKKAQRGKNTTRHSQIYKLSNGGLIVDTPGFNAFVLDDYTPEQVIDNYPDFKKLSRNCKYNNCNHINENYSICAVKSAVKVNQISQSRYQRFVEIFKTAKQKQEEKYD